MEYHKPVLLQECIDHLNINPTGTYIDVTFGGGGHSREILKHLSAEGKLYAFDQDPDAEANIPDAENFRLLATNFRHLKAFMRREKITSVDGILADLGISSHQIDQPERGFSLRFDGPLDMRMNTQKPKTAADVVNNYSEEQLTRVFKVYGEQPKARLMARAVINYRTAKPINTTTELKDALQSFAPKFRDGKFWAPIFQAIRIEVNEEMEALQEMLLQAGELLAIDGRFVVMSYHSLEDRLVKNYMKFGNLEGEPEKDFYGNLLRPLEPITRKPIIATEEETQANPRARSAKLRVAKKLPANG